MFISALMGSQFFGTSALLHFLVVWSPRGYYIIFCITATDWTEEKRCDVQYSHLLK